MFDVRVRQVPDQVLVSETRSVDQAGLEKWLPDAMARTGEAAGGLGGAGTTVAWPYLLREAFGEAPVFVVIYEGNPNEGEVPIEIGAALHPDRTASSDGLHLVPAHREAYVRVTKEVVQSGRLGQVYETIPAWLSAQGLQMDGPPRETYWTDFYEAGPHDDVFDVAWPIR